MKRKPGYSNEAKWIVILVILALFHAWILEGHTRKITALEREVLTLKTQKLAVVGPGFAREQLLQRMWLVKQKDRLDKVEAKADSAHAVAMGGLPDPKVFVEVERK